jgi:hypothetical protein
MPRTADASHITYMDGNRNYRLCKCYRIIRRDGVKYAFTDHDKQLAIDLGDGDGSNTYLPEIVADTSEIESKTNIGASNMEVLMALLESNSLSVEDALLGLFDDAILDVFEARWDVEPPTVLRGFCGLLSTGDIQDNLIQIQYRSLIGLYDQSVLRTVRRGCAYELGKNDEGFHRCPVQMNQASPLNPTLVPEWAPLKAHTKREDFDGLTEIGALVRPAVSPSAYAAGTSQVNANSPYSGSGTGAIVGLATVRGISDQEVNTKVWFKATNAGTTGSTEPSWPKVVGATVVDGSITWEAIQARNWSGGAVTGVTNNREFADTSNDFPDDWWAFGYLIWLSGLNAGKRIEVSYSKVNGDIKLFDRMKQNIQVGDTYDIWAGCDHFKQTCIDKFDTVWWFGGFDDAPGVMDLMQTPSAH